MKVLVVLAGLEQTLEALRPDLPDDITVLTEGFDGDLDFERWQSSYASDKPAVVVDPQDEFIQLYTSGTTGNPKGVVNSHHNVVSLALMNNTSTPLRSSAGSAGIICAPLFHIGGAGSVFMAVWAGQETILHQAFDPATGC